jgi:hypothetical protein
MAPVGAAWRSVEHAAAFLDLTPDALRKALERRARRATDGAIVAELDGVLARKLGRQWRIQLGPWATDELRVTSDRRVPLRIDRERERS